MKLNLVKQIIIYLDLIWSTKIWAQVQCFWRFQVFINIKRRIRNPKIVQIKPQTTFKVAVYFDISGKFLWPFYIWKRWFRGVLVSRDPTHKNWAHIDLSCLNINLVFFFFSAKKALNWMGHMLLLFERRGWTRHRSNWLWFFFYSNIVGKFWFRLDERFLGGCCIYDCTDNTDTQ